MKTFLQLIVMAAAGLAFGILINALSPKPLPLLASAEQFEIEVEEEIQVKSHEILELWESGEALFIDARSEDAFKQGRIPGAFSVPYDSLGEGDPEILKYLPTDQMLVIYCDGADCHASKAVYERLRELGFSEEHMKIFHGGWNEWLKLGGETEADGE